MFAVGLTGGIASGKSKVAELFHQKGIVIVDADNIAREVVMPKTPAWHAIVEHFGQAILLADGALNRRLLREKIFNDEHARAWLENLLHPLIRNLIQERLQNAASPYAIAVIPLLKSRADYPLLNRLLTVEAGAHLQHTRLMARDEMTSDTALAMIEAQPSDDFRRQLADDVIINNADENYLQHQVDQLHEQYIKQAGIA